MSNNYFGQKYFWRYCTACILSLFLLPTNSWGNNNIPAQKSLQPYSADYLMRRSGITVAVVQYQLTREGELVHFSATATPKGLARLMSSKPIIEQSVLSLSKGNLKPIHYKRQHTGKKDAKIKDMQIDYDHDGNQATVTIYENTHSFAIEDNLWDEASVQLAIMLDIEKNLSELNYRIIDDDELKEHHYTVAGDEIIETQVGKLETIKIVRDHGKRKTIMWLAKNKGYIPVKVQRYREEKLKSELLIKTHKNSI